MDESDRAAWNKACKKFNKINKEELSENIKYKTFIKSELIPSESLINHYKKQKKQSEDMPKIDLHNLSKEQAYKEIKEFIRINFSLKQKRILIITGNSLNNENSIKVELPKWLENDELKYYIKSCNQAPINKGGKGAYLVSLNNTKSH